MVADVIDMEKFIADVIVGRSFADDIDKSVLNIADVVPKRLSC